MRSHPTDGGAWQKDTLNRKRKLPHLRDIGKVELSGNIKPGAPDEDVPIHRDADSLDSEGSRRRAIGEGDLPEAWNQ